MGVVLTRREGRNQWRERGYLDSARRCVEVPDESLDALGRLIGVDNRRLSVSAARVQVIAVLHVAREGGWREKGRGGEREKRKEGKQEWMPEKEEAMDVPIHLPSTPPRLRSPLGDACRARTCAHLHGNRGDGGQVTRADGILDAPEAALDCPQSGLSAWSACARKGLGMISTRGTACLSLLPTPSRTK